MAFFSNDKVALEVFVNDYLEMEPEVSENTDLQLQPNLFYVALMLRLI